MPNSLLVEVYTVQNIIYLVFEIGNVLFSTKPLNNRLIQLCRVNYWQTPKFHIEEQSNYKVLNIRDSLLCRWNASLHHQITVADMRLRISASVSVVAVCSLCTLVIRYYLSWWQHVCAQVKSRLNGRIPGQCSIHCDTYFHFVSYFVFVPFCFWLLALIYYLLVSPC